MIKWFPWFHIPLIPYSIDSIMQWSTSLLFHWSLWSTSPLLHCFTDHSALLFLSILFSIFMYYYLYNISSKCSQPFPISYHGFEFFDSSFLTFQPCFYSILVFFSYFDIINPWWTSSFTQSICLTWACHYVIAFCLYGKQTSMTNILYKSICLTWTWWFVIAFCLYGKQKSMTKRIESSITQKWELYYVIALFIYRKQNPRRKEWSHR